MDEVADAASVEIVSMDAESEVGTSLSRNYCTSVHMRRPNAASTQAPRDPR